MTISETTPSKDKSSTIEKNQNIRTNSNSYKNHSSTKNKYFFTTTTAMPTKSMSRRLYGRFCFCDATGIDFSDLRELILLKQCRICPACKLKWRNIILIEKTTTVIDLICSFQGFLIILFVILQFAIFYYIAFLAVLEVQIARLQNVFAIEREILFGLTCIFVIVATWNLGWYVYKYAELATERVSEKIIIDVIMDLSDESKRPQRT